MKIRRLIILILVLSFATPLSAGVADCRDEDALEQLRELATQSDCKNEGQMLLNTRLRICEDIDEGQITIEVGGGHNLKMLERTQLNRVRSKLSARMA